MATWGSCRLHLLSLKCAEKVVDVGLKMGKKLRLDCCRTLRYVWLIRNGNNCRILLDLTIRVGEGTTVLTGLELKAGCVRCALNVSESETHFRVRHI